MIKWFAYIVLLLLLTPCLSFAKKRDISILLSKSNPVLADTTTAKKPADDDKKKIKEVTKARRQPKPEKVDATGTTAPAPKKPKTKPKRQRRPEGLERPPEIPRRDGN